MYRQNFTFAEISIHTYRFCFLLMNKCILSILAIFGLMACSRLHAQTEIPKGVNDLLVKHTCFTCHKADVKLIGPSWQEIASKKLKKAELVQAVYAPDLSRWPGYPPMMPMPQVPKKDLEKIADWLVKLKPSQVN